MTTMGLLSLTTAALLAAFQDPPPPPTAPQDLAELSLEDLMTIEITSAHRGEARGRPDPAGPDSRIGTPASRARGGGSLSLTWKF